MLAGLGVSIASVTRRWRFAAPCALLGAVAASASMIRLGVAFLGEDWRYEYIADHTRSGIAPLPRLAGLSGRPRRLAPAVGHPGRLGRCRRLVGSEGRGDTTLGRRTRRCPGRRLPGVVALVASPFDRLDIPVVDGLGLQPILEHPAMVWHPPLLYAGLVGLLVPSLAVVSSAWSGQSAHVPVRRWTIPSASSPPACSAAPDGLTPSWVGVATGPGIRSSRPVWPHGWPAWPHCTSSDGPRLSPSALVAIGVLPGLGDLPGPTLTRIGVVSSVHAFADRPALRISPLTVAGATSLRLRRRRRGRPPVGRCRVERPALRPTPAPASAAGSCSSPQLYVAAGPYQPLVEAATTGDRLAIAGTYFARILWPVAILGGAAAVRADRRWWAALVGAAIGCIAIPLDAGVYGLAPGGIGGAVAGSAVSLVRRRRPGAVAHVGAGLVLVGIAGTPRHTPVTAVRLVVDEPRSIDGLTLIHRSVGIDRSDVTSTATRASMSTARRSHRRSSPTTPRRHHRRGRAPHPRAR
ncbi:MAG: hypothetical protein R2710_23060 [Acidimicrobiales bacterium]